MVTDYILNVTLIKIYLEHDYMPEEFIELVFDCVLSTLVGVLFGVEAQEELQSIGMYLKHVLYLSSAVSLIVSLTTGALHLLSIINAGNVVGVQALQNLVITFSSQLSYYVLVMLVSHIVGFLYTMAGSLIGYMLNLIVSNDFNAPYL
mgnify:CR=1 FL=1